MGVKAQLVEGSSLEAPTLVPAVVEPGVMSVAEAQLSLVIGGAGGLMLMTNDPTWAL